ncbi:hypothetical protein H920_08401 [Fukomys damarensis]|uniref:Uncharacterized protein n=1 Tax=Fukomys damarensis TaxID=885580 RepID=A0A091E574_FUKDA|nr:hypothetical protein H920_08401 [Fukomys damarensis]
MPTARMQGLPMALLPAVKLDHVHRQARDVPEQAAFSRRGHSLEKCEALQACQRQHKGRNGEAWLAKSSPGGGGWSLSRPHLGCEEQHGDKDDVAGFYREAWYYGLSPVSYCMHRNSTKIAGCRDADNADNCGHSFKDFSTQPMLATQLMILLFVQTRTAVQGDISLTKKKEKKEEDEEEEEEKKEKT